MSDFLREMAVSSTERADRITRRFASADLELPIYPLELEGFDVIAEIKDRSPAEGELAAGGSDRRQRALQYASGGAAAISVLTEPARFAGSMDHLREVVETVSTHQTPVMRKDFLVDARQILQARAGGASGVLLIVAMLEDARLRALLDCAYDQGLFVLLESFDAADLGRSVALLEKERHLRAAQTRKLLFGINSRNLRTLAVEPKRLSELASMLPDDVVSVAESGLHSPTDASAAAASGYAMALIGTALMKSAQPDALLQEFLQAGRAELAA